MTSHGAVQESPASPSTVALVSAVSPYPTDAGKKVVLAGLIDYWVDRLGADDVHYVHVAPRGTPPAQMKPHYHRVEAPGALEQLGSVLRRTAARRRHSLQESVLHSERTRRALGAVLGSIGADLEIFDTIRMGQYARGIAPAPGTRRMIYLDDLFSVRYARILATMRQFPDVGISALGDFGRLLPAPARKLAQSRAVQRRLLDVERRIVARREVESATEFERSLLVSPEEVERLRAAVPGRSVEVLPPLVPAVSRERAYEPPPVFVLLGLLSLPHNHDAVVTFLETAMPQVRRSSPEAKVVIVGRGATPAIHELAERYEDQVEVAGFVPDLDELLARSCAVLAPLRFGSGIKIKVLEALGRGVPVIATPVAAEGIRDGAANGIVVEPRLERFPDAMARVADPTLNGTLSDAAREHHATTYAREAAYRRYDDVFGIARG